MPATLSVQGMEDAAPAAGSMSAADLAELMAAFNDVTARLQRTHESLRSEVVRLNGELREANEQLHRSRRLAGLGQMAAGIAHEVRNPLGSIGLYARMLVEDLADRPQEQQVASRIAEAVRGLDGVVGDVLNFARELRVRPAPADPGSLLEKALEACLADARWPDVAVRREWGSLARVSCEAPLIHQALVNVVRNALEAMEPGVPERVLTVGTSARTLGGPGAEKPAVGLRVSDTGPGVDPEIVERMFNPFFTTRAAGTGLGLAIVHRIVDAHGGRIEVRNNRAETPGAPGATIELVLPAAHGPGPVVRAALQESRE